jgi:sporulation protein YlmC with PRC-barrel domain
MPTPSIETARGWQGRVMVDRDSNKIGEVVDIYLDTETGRPEWAVVRTGLFGMRSTFAPLADAREVGDELQVPYQRVQVKEAPNIEPDGQLSEAEEAELYRHYGLDYDTVTLDSGSPAGQTLAEPAGQTDKPERNDQAGATATRVPTAPAGQDRHSVGEGEGVSRPFVYETPGRPEGGAGTRRRQPGQVRLRRYLVTEVVTDTEAGQRHEVRVQSEPVSDAEVDAVVTAPDRQGEPVGQEPNGPGHNDWFSDESDPRH